MTHSSESTVAARASTTTDGAHHGAPASSSAGGRRRWRAQGEPEQHAPHRDGEPVAHLLGDLDGPGARRAGAGGPGVAVTVRSHECTGPVSSAKAVVVPSSPVVPGSSRTTTSARGAASARPRRAPRRGGCARRSRATWCRVSHGPRTAPGSAECGGRVWWSGVGSVHCRPCESRWSRSSRSSARPSRPTTATSSSTTSTRPPGVVTVELDRRLRVVSGLHRHPQGRPRAHPQGPRPRRHRGRRRRRGQGRDRRDARLALTASQHRRHGSALP